MICRLENWRYLLAGTKSPIRVLLDHKNLTYWKDGHNIGHRVARWMGILADYNISIEHHPGTKNRADPLSRRPDHDDGSRDNLNITVLPNQLFARTMDIVDVEMAVINAQKHNESTIKLWARTYPNITQKADDVWWNNDRLIVVEDNALRRGVTSLYHDSTTAGHPSTLKTCIMAAKDFWWPKMGTFIQEYIKGCATCQATKAATNKPKPPLFPITTNPDALPFKDVAIDLIVKLPMSHGYDSILMVTDQGCSKAAIMIPCREATDAEGMAQLYGQHVFPHYGIPRSIISDRDTRFASTFTKELCRCIGTRQNISTAYHPQTDRQSERTNQWLEQYLRIFVNHRQDDWAKWLPITQYVHNAWPSSTTKLPPFELIMGYTPRAHQIKSTPKLPTLQDRIKHMRRIRQEAQIAI
jgi:Integrase zinc binding domain/RNase H-like domain found in reverse transcriptase